MMKGVDLPMFTPLKAVKNPGIIIISIFKEDNVFSIIASLPYGPPVNTDIDYYQTFFSDIYFCKCCNVSCAIFVRRRDI